MLERMYCVQCDFKQARVFLAKHFTPYKCTIHVIPLQTHLTSAHECFLKSVQDEDAGSNAEESDIRNSDVSDSDEEVYSAHTHCSHASNTRTCILFSVLSIKHTRNKFTLSILIHLWSCVSCAGCRPSAALDPALCKQQQQFSYKQQQGVYA